MGRTSMSSLLRIRSRQAPLRVLADFLYKNLTRSIQDEKQKDQAIIKSGVFKLLLQKYVFTFNVLVFFQYIQKGRIVLFDRILGHKYRAGARYLQPPQKETTCIMSGLLDFV